MRSITVMAALPLLCAVMACPPQEPQIPHPVLEEARASWDAFHIRYPNSEVEWDSLTGVAGTVGLFHAGPYQGQDSRERALSFLRENYQLLGMDSAIGQLAYDTTIATRTEGRTGIEYVRFHQVYRGEPVYGTETVAHVTDSGRVFRVYNRFFPTLTVTGERQISEREAISLAERKTPAQPDSRVPTVAERVIYANGPVPIPAWRVQLGLWIVVVDGLTGNILVAFEAIRRQTGQVFTQNKCDTPTRVDAPFTNLDGTGLLRGTFFDVVGANGRVSVPTLDYTFTESQEGRLAQTEVYYQLERAQAYFAGLGFTASPLPISATANTSDKCNAFFFGGTGDFFEFGTSSNPWWPWSSECFNPGWDGEVVVHEFGHKVIDQLAGLGFSLNPASVHEGMADYFAASFFGDPCVAETLRNRSCNKCLRNADNDLRLNNKLDESHKRGRVLAGAFWDIRQLLGANFADQAAFGAIGGLPSNAGFTDVAVGAINAGVASFGDLDSFLEVFVAAVSVQAMIDAFCSHGIRLPSRIGRCPYIDWWEGRDFSGRFHTRTMFTADGGDCLRLNNNDAMKSIKFYGRPGWRLRIYDSASCSTSDDWGELTFPNSPEAVVELPRLGWRGPNRVNPPGAYDFHHHNGLPGKVSAIRHLP